MLHKLMHQGSIVLWFSKIKRVFGVELEQFQERVEQSFEHPRNPPTGHKRERLPKRGVRVEDEEYEGMALRMRLIITRLLVTGGMGGGLENLGTGKIIIWVVFR